MKKMNVALIAGGGCVVPLVGGGLLAATIGMGMMSLSSEGGDTEALCAEAAMSVSIDGEVPDEVAGYGKEELENAATIMEVGEDEGISARGQLIAIMTAMQESQLENIDYGDRDSLGLYQQRPSVGWGSPEQITDPTYSAKAFYVGVDADGGHIPGLKDIDGWEDMALTEAAQAVQASAFPDHYAKHETAARQIMSALSGVDVSLGDEPGAANCDTDAGGSDTATGDMGKVIEVAKSTEGLPYVFGAGGWDGPTQGGQDCSGLTTYAFNKGAGIRLPRTARDTWSALRSHEVDASDLKPGDLIFEAWGRLGDEVSHVSIYIGNGKIIEATRSGGSGSTRISDVRTEGYQFVGIARVPEDFKG